MPNTANSAPVKAQVAEVLGLDESTFPYWEIESSVPEAGLYLVHYAKDADVTKYGWLRGTIIDIQAKCIVCQSFGYTPTAKLDVLAPDHEGTMKIRDTDGIDHVIDFDQTVVKCGFEGTVMYLFLHNGIVYRSTHRRIRPVESRWGDSIPFNAMYDTLGGPADSVMFDLSKGKYSPYVHMFMMVHPDILSCSKQDVGTGYMVYLGVRQAYSLEPEFCPYDQEKVSSTGKPYSGPIDPAIRMPATISSPPQKIEKPFLTDLFEFDLQQANDHLAYGFYEPYEFSFDDEPIDPRLGCGEFVMLYRYDKQGRLMGLLKIVSTAYHWRCSIRDDNPNISHRLYQLIDDSYIATDTREGMNLFKEKYPIIYPFEVDSIVKKIEGGPQVLWTQPRIESGSSVIATKDQRYYNIWICMVMSVPLHRQLETTKLYNQIIAERIRIVDWLRQFYRDGRHLSEERASQRRAVAIVKQAVKFAQEKAVKGIVTDRQGNKLSIPESVGENIRNLISKEQGKSLYRLAKLIKDETRKGRRHPSTKPQ